MFWNPKPKDESPSAGAKGIKYVQQVVGSILYYGRGVDATTLPALSTLGSEQSQTTTKTVEDAKHQIQMLASATMHRA